MGVLERCDATAIAGQIRAGQLTRAAVAEHFLARIAEHEPQVQAFAHFDRALIERQAHAPAEGPLAGVPIGIKDNFDSFDQPTEFFSSIYHGNQPSRDSQVVALLRQAGALIMGKTHTTEFAYMHTGPTRNPRGLAHTPGSSSAGSAAGMAAGLFALALGTQTAGSLLKPAAYCGLHAFKPSYGLVSLEGVKPLAPSFDTVGWFGRSVRDLGLLADVLIGGLPALRPLSGHLAVCRTARAGQVQPLVARAFDAALEVLRAGGLRLSEITLPVAFDRVFDDQQTINDCEGARSLAVEAQANPRRLSAETQAMLARGQACSWAEESAAKARLAALAPQLAALMAPYDACLGYSCGMLAPKGLGSTGPSDFIKHWMAFGLPQINVPLNVPAGQLPIGIQLIGMFRDDAQLLAVAERVDSLLR